MKYQPGLHKLVHHLDHLSWMKDGIVAPIHVSVWPTKRCQLKCDYCMFRKYTDEGELGLEEFKEAITVLSSFGTKAIEFSGGGEPLLWPHFEHAVLWAKGQGLKLSLITNGIALNGVSDAILKQFDWIRISVTSIDRLQEIDIERIKKVTRVSLSYIVPNTYKDPSAMLSELYWISGENDIVTRIATEKPSGNGRELEIKRMVNEYVYGVFFYSEKPEGSPKGCYMPWIRAAIDWRGNFLPCPGITHAPEHKGLIPDSFILCHIKDLEEWISKNKPHDLGHRCLFCNCGKEINDFIHEIFTKVEDVDFV